MVTFQPERCIRGKTLIWKCMLRLNARYLAALAALSLSFSLLWLIVLDSKSSSLPDQTQTLQLMGVMHMEVDEVADMVMDMEVDKVVDEVADKVADMVMKILTRTI